MKSYQVADAFAKILGAEESDFSPTAKNKVPLVMEGELRLWCQEGGFASDAIEIDGEELSSKIAEHFETETKPHSGNTDVAIVRVTIEVVG